MTKIKSTKYLIYGLLVLAVICFSTAVTAVRAEEILIIELKEDTDRFEPVTHQDWDYYVIPPGVEHEGVTYTGKDTDAHHTEVGTNSLADNTQVVTDGGAVHDLLLQDDKRYGNHPLIEPEIYPRAVTIKKDSNPALVKTQKLPLNLHMDYSFTFLAESNTEYFGLIESTESFILDIFVRDCNAEGSIIFGSAYPFYFYFPDTLKKMSLPVFPTEGTVQNFTIFLDDTSLITLTPHPLTLPKTLATIGANGSYSGDIEQGAYFEQDGSDIMCAEKNLFSLRSFDLTITEGEYYRIYVDIVDLCYGCSGYTSSSNTMPFLITGESDIIDVLTGSLDQDGLLIKANEAAAVSLVLYSIGWIQQTYTVYFRNVSPPEAIPEKTLVLGEDTELEEDMYYSFTLANPSMIAVNETGNNFFDFYEEGSEPGKWNYVTDYSFFNIEDGWLVGNSAGDIGTNWFYLPAGTYAVKLYSKSQGDEIRFTIVTVQNPSTLNVNQDSIIAVEIPLVKNRISYINISTSDHINQTLYYEFSLVGKYNEFYSVYSYSLSGLGNRQTGGSWVSWDYNNTIIYKDTHALPTRSKEVPILMIRPFQAVNLTDPIDTFTATLTVSNNVPIDYYPAISKTNFGGGAFIPQSSITGTTSYTVNDEITTDNDQIFGIPMNLEVNSLYNITVTVTGNYTAAPDYNLTIQAVYAHGGNLQSIIALETVYDNYPFDGKPYFIDADETSKWVSFLVMTVSTTSYLYVDINRVLSSSYLNGTLEISIAKVPANELAFEMPELSNYGYNATVNEKEMKNEKTLATSVKPASAPGFELIGTIVTLVIMTPIAVRKRMKRN